MEGKTIRLLRADEIECRVSAINERGLALLLFKDARVDQRILDETFTPFGWRRSHQSIDGNLYCTVEVWDPGKMQWIGKQDVGTMSYSEKEKGQASDSFKRACFNWGIGRELYTAPFIWVSAEKVKIQPKWEKCTAKEQQYITKERFYVHSIGYDKDRNICALEIRDSKGAVLFSLKNKKGQAVEDVKAALGQKASNQKSSEQCMIPSELQQELDRTGIGLDVVLSRYSLTDISQMTPEIYRDAITGLRRSKSKQAA